MIFVSSILKIVKGFLLSAVAYSFSKSPSFYDKLV